MQCASVYVSDSNTLLKTACADGLKGYILEYKSEPLTPISAVGCAFSRDCSLPGNK